MRRTDRTAPSEIKRVRGTGFRRITRACANALRDHADQIAATLLDLSLKGNTSCTRLLVDLAEKAPQRAPRKPKVAPRRSAAMQWASEPEWVFPDDDPMIGDPNYLRGPRNPPPLPDALPIDASACLPPPPEPASYTEGEMNETPIPALPNARIEPKETVLHGITLRDDYAWLRDKDAPEVRQYLEAENTYADAVTAPLAGLRDTLYNEMLSHIKQTDVSVPYRDGSWWYYARTEESLQYAISCRKRGADDNTGSHATGPLLNAPEQVILDGNQLAKGHAFFSLGATDITDDGRWLAYTTDTTGFRQYTLHIKDLESGDTLPGTVERIGSVVWAADNRSLFYTVEDEEQKRQYQLWRHTLGTEHSADVLVYQDDDERFNLGAGRTRDGKYIILESASHITTESHVLAADNPTGNFTLITAREDEHEYAVDHRNGFFFIRTNDKGRNFRLVTAPVNTPGREHWTELIPHRADIMLEDVDLFASFFVACERENGLPRLRLWFFSGSGLDAAQTSEIAFPEPAYSAGPHINRIFDTTSFRYGYQSLVTPSSVFVYDIPTGSSTLLKQVEIPGGFDRTLYASERLHATASDGTQIPVSLVYRKDKREAGNGAPTDRSLSVEKKNPLYVYGYGSYGYALPLGFSSNRLSLLDRGVVLAYAHVRGGGDLGKPWHDAGKMLVKRNTFTDFIAIVEHLTKSGYGDPARVAIEGGSAGGLLMGAVTNLRPDLFRAVLSHVPFVDVMNTMLDETLPLTVPEYEEWGNPNEETYFKYMLSYSPYDNLVRASYPAMLVKTSLFDSQVMYWEPAKYVARLRTLKTDANPLLLVTNMQAGHGGASGRYDYLKEIAFDYAFLLKELAVV
ncbi:MAG TPA: prolyl oligopeptidase family serine peptidase [Terracidiphilus sp.]|nr:prolyl oligopeptidase family serine peptidase [Terracidiphilus sp.]